MALLGLLGISYRCTKVRRGPRRLSRSCIFRSFHMIHETGSVAVHPVRVSPVQDRGTGQVVLSLNWRVISLVPKTIGSTSRGPLNSHLFVSVGDLPYPLKDLLHRNSVISTLRRYVLPSLPEHHNPFGRKLTSTTKETTEWTTLIPKVNFPSS